MQTLVEAREFLKGLERVPPLPEAAQRREVEVVLQQTYLEFPELERAYPLSEIRQRLRAAQTPGERLSGLHVVASRPGVDGRRSPGGSEQGGNEQDIKAVCNVLDGMDEQSDENMRSLGQVTKHLLFPDEAGYSMDSSQVATLLLSARKRLAKAALPHVAVPRSASVLLQVSEGARAKIGMQPAAQARARAAPPGAQPLLGRLRYAEFASQWRGPEAREVDWFSAMDVGAAGERRGDAICAKRGRTGHIVSGPYFRLAAGKYRARIGLHVEPKPKVFFTGPPQRKREVVLEAVADSGNHYLVQVGLVHRQLLEPEHDMEFEITPEMVQGRKHEVELRIWTRGRIPLAVSAITVFRVA